MFDILYKKYDKLVLSKKELAAELGVSTKTIERQLKSGELPIAYNVMGGQYLFSLRGLVEFLEAMELVA